MGERPRGPPRDTNVTPTRGSELYWEERELLKRKLKAWLRGEYVERKSAWLTMRTTPTIPEIYSRAPEEVKQAARRALEAVLIAWFLGEPRVEYSQPGGSPQIFNININVNENRAEARAESKAEAKSRLELEATLEAAKQIVEALYKMMASSSLTPPKQRQLIEELYKLLKGVN